MQKIVGNTFDSLIADWDFSNVWNDAPTISHFLGWIGERFG